MKENMEQRKLEATFKARKWKQDSRARQSRIVSQQLPVTNIEIPNISVEEKQRAFSAFDKANAQLVYSQCHVCHQIRLDWKVVPITFDKKRLMCCNKCKNLKKVDLECNHQWLPTWKDSNNKIHYEVPKELAVLREGEKLLIQRLSVYVPVYHLYKGQTASKGHCAAFKQDINTIADRLPRLPEEVEFVQIIKKYRDSNGDAGEKQFVIRKSVVLDALKWLKQHNKQYRDVVIAEENLSWIEGDEAELPNERNQKEIVDDPDSAALHDGQVINNQKQVDTGPSYSQVVQVEEQETDPVLKQHGIMVENFGNQPEKNFDSITAELQKAAKEAYQQGQDVDFGYTTSQQRTELPIVTQEHDVSNDDNSSANANDADNTGNEQRETLPYPSVEEKAVDEFDTTLDIFCMAFPWLFPGGYGGPFEPNPFNTGLRQWLENCAYYEDGRFIRDKVFAFYALNYVNRHTNASQGKYYINQHNKEFDDLEDLQEAIKKGLVSWISKLIYFSSQVKGSVPYWRDQRGKIHTWVDYHIATGNGPPTLFITLSCAEFFWQDINRLLFNRFNFPDVQNPLTLNAQDGRYNTVKNVNDMTIVVQEYFQKRIKNWLNKIGKPIFKILEYWLRFEFAPTRGQIHCHMLAITEHNQLLKLAMDKFGSVKNMTDFLAEWMQKSFGMTAELPEIPNDGIDVDVELLAEAVGESAPSEIKHPSTFNWSDKFVQDNPILDCINLLKQLQMHKCNAYCMRKRSKL